MRILLTLALIAVGSLSVGCTCNDANNPAARPRAGKMGKMRGKKAKRKWRGKAKRRRGKANVQRIPVTLYYVDEAKLAAGDEDPWVEVKRDVGAKTPAKNAVWQLLKGPQPGEGETLKLFKSDAAGFRGFRVEGDTATLALRGGCDSGGSTVTVYDHIEKTLKAFPEIEHVKLLDHEGNTQNADGEGDSRPACLEP